MEHPFFDQIGTSISSDDLLMAFPYLKGRNMAEGKARK
jgi:hypothetical protein